MFSLFFFGVGSTERKSGIGGKLIKIDIDKRMEKEKKREREKKRKKKREIKCNCLYITFFSIEKNVVALKKSIFWFTFSHLVLFSYYNAQEEGERKSRGVNYLFWHKRNFFLLTNLGGQKRSIKIKLTGSIFYFFFFGPFLLHTLDII